MSFAPGDILYNQYNFDPVVFAWNMDPKTMPGRSPYEVFGNNPVLNVDPMGNKFLVHGYRTEKGKPMLNPPMSDDEVEIMWKEMAEYLHTHGLGDLYDKLENSEIIFHIHFTTDDKMFRANPDNNSQAYISMNPFQASKNDRTGYIMNPIEGLVHEFGHAYNFHLSPAFYWQMKKTKDWQYGNVEERSVIEGIPIFGWGKVYNMNYNGIEQMAKTKLGTPIEGMTRTDHQGSPEPVPSWKPISDNTECFGCYPDKGTESSAEDSKSEKSSKSEWAEPDDNYHNIKVENGE